MSFQIRPTTRKRRGAVSMMMGLNLLQSLIERRPEKAPLVRLNAASEAWINPNLTNGKVLSDCP
jgi:hypothetical protein